MSLTVRLLGRIVRVRAPAVNLPHIEGVYTWRQGDTLSIASAAARVTGAVLGGAILGALAFPFQRWKAVDPRTL